MTRSARSSGETGIFLEKIESLDLEYLHKNSAVAPDARAGLFVLSGRRRVCPSSLLKSPLYLYDHHFAPPPVPVPFGSRATRRRARCTGSGRTRRTARARASRRASQRRRRRSRRPRAAAAPRPRRRVAVQRGRVARDVHDRVEPETSARVSGSRPARGPRARRQRVQVELGQPSVRRVGGAEYSRRRGARTRTLSRSPRAARRLPIFLLASPAAALSEGARITSAFAAPFRLRFALAASHMAPTAPRATRRNRGASAAVWFPPPQYSSRSEDEGPGFESPGARRISFFASRCSY